jgi:N-acetylglutamate synthase-like GNAT family acetyltransferase
MIPRSLNELYETLRDFVICEADGDVRGVCSLHIMGRPRGDKVTAVDARYHNMGIGKV